MSGSNTQDAAYQKAHIEDDQGLVIIGIASMFLVLCTLVVGARVVVRRIKDTPLGLDDWFCFIAYVSYKISSKNRAHLYS